MKSINSVINHVSRKIWCWSRKSNHRWICLCLVWEQKWKTHSTRWCQIMFMVGSIRLIHEGALSYSFTCAIIYQSVFQKGYIFPHIATHAPPICSVLPPGTFLCLPWSHNVVIVELPFPSQWLFVCERSPPLCRQAQWVLPRSKPARLQIR